MKSIDITSDLNTKDGSLGLENQKTATKDYQTMERSLTGEIGNLDLKLKHGYRRQRNRMKSKVSTTR